MNIHEYQAKKILKQFKINVPDGGIAYTPLEAQKTAAMISARGPWILKAQIQAGARAKGHFKEKSNEHLTGICPVYQLKDVFLTASKMLGKTLVTPQTKKSGRPINKIYVEVFCKSRKNFYLSFIVNRMTASVTLLVSATTDNIVDLSLKSPQSVLKINLDLNEKIKIGHVQKILEFLHLKETLSHDLKIFLSNLYKVFVSKNATLLEINPVGLTKEGKFIALDAKISFDDNALFKHPEISVLRDNTQESPNVLRALKLGFKYHEFEKGNIGLIVNGDGLAFSLHDLLKKTAVDAACYLNIKGSIDSDKIAAGLKILMTNPKVEGIIINILGGFLRCHLVADGIIAAISEAGLNIPFVVRFEGTNKKEAEEILKNSRLPVLVADSMEDAVQKMLEAMKESE